MPSETSRIEAFSDGVFSIAATLLVLELKAPPPTMPFWAGIFAQWPGFAAFLLSFLFIGIMWINHHRLFSHVRRSDEGLMLANLLLLLGVVWIPYPTSLIAQTVGTARFRDAVILYNGSYFVIALLFNVLMFTCVHRELVDRNFGTVRNLGRRFMTGPTVYALCVALTWWNVNASLAVNFAMALYFLLSPDHSFKEDVEHHRHTT